MTDWPLVRQLTRSGAAAWTMVTVLVFGPLASAAAAQSASQSPSLLPAIPPAVQNPAAAPPAPPSEPPTDVDLVRKGLSFQPNLSFREDRLRFYTSTKASAEPATQTFAEYAKGYDFWHGATKGGNPMSHQEFVNMVTPRELYGSGGIQAIELLQFAFTNWLGQTLVKRGLEELKEARSEQEAKEIRERIQRELTILNRSSAAR